MSHGPVGPFPVAGKIICITGGGSGIGLAFARLALTQSVRGIIIGDLKLTSEAETFISSSSSPSSIIFTQCDVSKWSDLANLITVSVKHFQSVPDVYVPCAGVYEPPWSNFWDDVETETYRMMQINVNHPVKLTRLAMRALAGERKKGVVCLVASTAGLRANYFSALYSTSKHAVVGFAKSMGQADPDEGVKVVAICPGMVASPLWTDRTDDRARATHYHDRPAMQPNDVAETMLAMVESDAYSGGTVVLKTVETEKVVEKGISQRSEADDPAPRPSPDFGHIKGILESERGVPWNPDLTR